MDISRETAIGEAVDDSEAEVNQLETEISLSIPVIREELNVQIRKYVTGVVRVKKIVGEREEWVDLPASRTNFVVERIPLNKIVSEPPPVREEGETTIFSVVEEILVTTKQYVVKEEVRISRQHSQAPRHERFSLRTEELVIEREPLSTPITSNHTSGDSNV